MSSEQSASYIGSSGPVVTVRGEASVEVESDLVDLHLTARARGTDRPVVLRDLEVRAAELGALIDRFDTAIERRSTDSFSVHPEFGGSKGGKVRGYSGQLSTHLTLHDFSVLSDLVVGANAIELTDVGSPYWRLRHDHPAYREARLAAITDGLTRARDYAAAFGAGIDALLSISDDGTDVESVMPRFSRGAGVAAMAFGGGDDDISFDFEPERQRVEGTVVLRFRMSTPTLPA
jgi:uncharacterized protein YggE